MYSYCNTSTITTQGKASILTENSLLSKVQHRIPWLPCTTYIKYAN